jgi:hypothetical protein
VTYDVRNPGPGLGQAKNVVVLNQLIESQHELVMTIQKHKHNFGHYFTKHVRFM